METPPTIERELQRKPPRHIANRAGKWGIVRPWLFLLIPHFWIAVAAPIVFFALVLDTFVVEPIPGKVIAHHEYYSKKSDTTSYSITYEFTASGKSNKSSNTVAQSRYESLKDGDSVTVYAMPGFPWFMPRLQQESSTPIGILIFLAIWCLVWCGCMFSIAFVMLDQPLRSRALTKQGIPALATITNVQNNRGRRNDNYKVLYTYEAKIIDKKSNKKVSIHLNGNMRIKNSEYGTAMSLIGKQVTVLVDEKRPQRSILYPFSDYMAIN